MEENYEQKVSPASPPPNSSNFWKELLKLALAALIIVVPFRLYVAQPFIVDGASMVPTFKDGQYLIVDELTYHLKDPSRGQVLVFRYPKDPSKYFIKRLIGLPGEEVSINNGQVTIKEQNGESLTLDEPYIELEKKDTLHFNLGSDEYFVMGDNRLQSADSRLWGSVPRANIVGRPILRFFPPGIFPGQATYQQE